MARATGMNSLQGHFLIAAPNLDDPNFFRTVVLMIEHHDLGAMGVVLNRPSDKLLREVWSQVSDAPCETDEPIYVGGPVSGPLLAVHDREEYSELEVLPGVHLATNKGALSALVASQTAKVRYVADYAGWGKGQLESELQMGGWLTTPATSELVFSDPDPLWSEVVEIAEDLIRRIIPPDQMPPDPSVN